jgi:hypothetical protein
VEGLASALTTSGQQLSILLITTSPGGTLDPGQTWLVLPGYLASGFLWVMFFIIILLFPDGRLPSTGWRPFARVASVVALTGFFNIFFPEPMKISQGLSVNNPLGIPALAPLIPWWSLVQLLTMAIGLVCFLAPVLRYRRARGVERQQLKWLGVGTGFLALCVAAFMLSRVLTLPPLLNSVIGVLAGLGAAIIPLLMTLAILRYRLYDIDLIIRRTLIYGALTTLLAGIYFGGVVLFQALLRPVTGEGNDLAIVATTLLIAALFLPLRRSIQGFIDRRFYRRKYDAARTLATFSETARDEVDLQALTGHLVAVVEETMQPAYASLWLRTPEGDPQKWRA